MPVEHYGILARNPVLRRYRPVVAIRERAFLAPSDSWKLLRHCEQHYVGRGIWLQLLAGMRPGEMQALRWNCVDFERNQILIRATYNRKEKCLQEHPKQEDWGRAPMVPELRRFLWDRRGGEQEFVAPGEPGQPSKEDGRMLSYETYEDGLKRLCNELCITKVTPHELRHSCTELFIQFGASAEDMPAPLYGGI
ncbi:MAG: hypothetical protein A2583_10095 [Bdellovibrionales bacterium RIFOXYD1_FULL_53_11]|nr:MAG: hypothetical protein A2583_10095 [Bdellovibrionales bacterium RIFOXYD1_FULL_53_11]